MDDVPSAPSRRRTTSARPAAGRLARLSWPSVRALVGPAHPPGQRLVPAELRPALGRLARRDEAMAHDGRLERSCQGTYDADSNGSEGRCSQTSR